MTPVIPAKSRPQGPLATTALVVLIGLLIALVVNAWGEQGLSPWFPALVASAIIVALVVGAHLKVGKDGFELDTRGREGAKDELRKATRAKGKGKPPAPTIEARIESLGRVERRDILWVDDHPENNVHEMLMLSHLGFRATTATSTEDAELFLRSVHFDVVVTDLGRGDDPEAGVTFTKRVHELLPDRAPPVVVYTSGHDERGELAIKAGATSVATMPDELLDQILRLKLA